MSLMANESDICSWCCSKPTNPIALVIFFYFFFCLMDFPEMAFITAIKLTLFVTKNILNAA